MAARDVNVPDPLPRHASRRPPRRPARARAGTTASACGWTTPAPRWRWTTTPSPACGSSGTPAPSCGASPAGSCATFALRTHEPGCSSRLLVRARRLHLSFRSFPLSLRALLNSWLAHRLLVTHVLALSRDATRHAGGPRRARTSTSCWACRGTRRRTRSRSSTTCGRGSTTRTRTRTTRWPRSASRSWARPTRHAPAGLGPQAFAPCNHLRERGELSPRGCSAVRRSISHHASSWMRRCSPCDCCIAGSVRTSITLRALKAAEQQWIWSRADM